MHVFNHDGTYVTGWPAILEGFAFNTVVADLDGDGRSEVIVGAHSPARLHVLGADGTPFSGAWPREFEHGVWSPATADLDGDGDLEILASDGLLDEPNLIYAMHHDGVDVNGWPVWIPGFPNSRLVVGDVDGDGSPEIACATFEFFNGMQAWVYLLNSQGQTYSKDWSVPLPTAGDPWAMAMGDLDGDGGLEILITGTMPQVFALDRFGNFTPGWPAIVSPLGSNFYNNRGHSIADVDGDGLPEVVVGTVVGIRVFNRDATPVPGASPLPVIDDHTNAKLQLTVTVADVDLDGDVEIFSGIWRTPGALDFTGPECSVQWERSSGDLGNTGRYVPPRIDASEWVLFNNCFTGPAAVFLPPECDCRDADADSDADIDLADFAALQRAFTPRP